MSEKSVLTVFPSYFPRKKIKKYFSTQMIIISCLAISLTLFTHKLSKS